MFKMGDKVRVFDGDRYGITCTGSEGVILKLSHRGYFIDFYKLVNAKGITINMDGFSPQIHDVNRNDIELILRLKPENEIQFLDAFQINFKYGV